MSIKITISHRKDTRQEDYKPFNPYRVDLLTLITKFINEGIPPLTGDCLYLDNDGKTIPFVVYDRLFIGNEVMYIITEVNVQEDIINPEKKRYLN